ncbi:MAG: ParB N-terminal domain-containing protein [Planctomycetota bacterium]|jgi:ParB-like chromosome segregation protein Spo0J
MSKIAINPKIRVIEISKIKPSTRNPRTISNEALTGLQMSLEQFGYVDLIILNERNMRIIAGHQRYKILKADGANKV